MHARRTPCVPVHSRVTRPLPRDTRRTRIAVITGNQTAPVHDFGCMKCTDCREQLSARLDGEDDPRASTVVDRHLDACAACLQWYDDAARVTRLARTSVAQPTPDLVETVLAHAPAPRRFRPRTALRVALTLVGISQLVLGAMQIFHKATAVDAMEQAAIDPGGTSVAHFWHEGAAWNIALGVGFLWIVRRRQARGMLPTLSAFVLLLVLLSGIDIVVGRVDDTRLSSHVLVLVGYALVLALVAAEPGGGGFVPRARPTLPRSDDEADVAAPAERWPDRTKTPACDARRDTRPRDIPAA
jgi:predicted anti-sigma-YlaC factor YlaD